MTHEDALELIKAVNALRITVLPLVLVIFTAALWIASEIREKK